jgi:UDP-glucose 4-epimerase
VREVIDTIEQISGQPVPDEEVGRRAGDPVALYADNSRIRAELGWTPTQGLDEIVASAWRWHSSVAGR